MIEKYTKPHRCHMADGEPDLALCDFGHDYKAWTDAISKVDILESRSFSQHELTRNLALYAEFLKVYPWLYAYWIQYANLLLAATDDFSRATALLRNEALAPSALKYSIEMWSEYLKFQSLHHPANAKTLIHAVYIEALENAGSLFGAGPLWRSAVSLETELSGRPFFLLAKAMCYPVNEIRELWADLQAVLPKTPTAELLAFAPDLPLSELLGLSVGAVEFGDEQTVRSEAIEKLSVLYHNALKNQCKRLKYESLITRTYFHFNSPDESQIMNWENYITMLEEDGTEQERIELFERALIPCAHIEGIWIRYANYAETLSLDFARQIYGRIPYRVMPRTRILFAEFEEQNSHPDVCRAIYQELAESDVAELIIAAAHFELRSGDASAAVAILTAARDRLMEDVNGCGLIAAELLEIGGVESDIPPSAVYIAKLANRVITADPQRANTILYEAILGKNRVLLEDRVPLLKLYLELLRQFGTEANFQLEMELLFHKLSNLLVWHKDYFGHSFLASAQPPEARPRAWIEYQKQIPPDVT
jgi:hypothetical protein